LAFIWDTPLLFEAGLQDRCDTVVFVDAPLELRLDRVGKSRGWDRAQLLSRENLQWPLDKKRKISDHIVDNTADAEYARGQVREVLFRILARRLPAET
jgi:dephospho-CoA kinase